MIEGLLVKEVFALLGGPDCVDRDAAYHFCYAAPQKATIQTPMDLCV
jgi:hypothetical protein